MYKLSSLVILLLLVSGNSLAAPMYYTFEGDIDTVEGDVGYLSERGITIGALVSYTFVIDDELPGYHTRPDGTRNYYPMEYGYYYPGSSHYRFADLISGPILENPNINSYAADYPDEDHSINYINMDSEMLGRSTTISAGSYWNYFELWQGTWTLTGVEPFLLTKTEPESARREVY